MRRPTSKSSRYTILLAHGVRLVGIDTARVARGLTARRVIEVAEDHRHRQHIHAFDLGVKSACGRHRRELRFWAGALKERPYGRGQQLATIADCLLTTVDRLKEPLAALPSSQLERAWTVSNQHITRLLATGEIRGFRAGRNWKVYRSSAAKFLKRRAL